MKTFFGYVVAFVLGVSVSFAAFTTCPVLKKAVVGNCGTNCCKCVGECCPVKKEAKKGCCEKGCVCVGECKCCAGCCK